MMSFKSFADDENLGKPADNESAEEELTKDEVEEILGVNDEMAALEESSANDLVEELEKIESGPEVQLEEETRQTYEFELRTELEMRPRDDVMKMAEMRGLKFDPLASKGRLMSMILRAEGFEAPNPPEAAPDVPRYSVRVRRALESQQRGQ
jgi:hypothetical protein